jgi:hypothetical protein
LARYQHCLGTLILTDMKPLLLLAFLGSFLMAAAQPELNSGSLLLGGGYTHDYPKMNGYSLLAEFLTPADHCIQAGFGAKYVNLNGYPQTSQVDEYLQAFSIDLNLYWVPLQSGPHVFRLGPGYAVSFYNKKQAYPTLPGGSIETPIVWEGQFHSGWHAGLSLIAEYAYVFPGSDCSLGLRAALYQEYDRTWFVGPRLGIGL